MKDKHTHNRNFGGEFPKPGVPADDAWKQMQAMLVENNLTQPENKDKRRLIVLWLLLLFVIAVGISGYLLWGINAEKKKHTANTSTNTKSKTNNDVLLKTNSIEKKNVKNVPANNGLMNTKNSVTVHNALVAKQFYTLKDLTNISSNKINLSKNNNENETSNAIANANTIKQIAVDDSLKNDVTANNNNSINHNKIIDTSGRKINADTTIKFHPKNTTALKNKFHFGLEWNADFSLQNNSHYFNDYTGGKQYYMWLLPSAWAKFNINKKHGLLLTFNPYKQQLAGAQKVRIEKPWIASVEPDIVTHVIKTGSIHIGLNYTYQINKHFSLQAGGGYSFIQNVLYKEQAVEGFSGNVLSEKLYGAKKKDANFNYLKPSYLNWNADMQYDLKKISFGAGLNQSFSNLSADSNYTVRPLNGSIYLRYRFK